MTIHEIDLSVEDRAKWARQGVEVRDLAAIRKDCPERTPYGVFCEKRKMLPACSLMGGAVRFSVGEPSEAVRAAVAGEGGGAFRVVNLSSTSGPLRAANVGLTDRGVPVAWASVNRTVFDRIQGGRDVGGSTWAGIPGYFVPQLNGLLALTKAGRVYFAVECGGDVLAWGAVAGRDHVEEVEATVDAFWKGVLEVKPPAISDRDVLDISVAFSQEERQRWLLSEKAWLKADDRLTKLKEEVKALENERGEAEAVLAELVRSRGGTRGRGKSVQICAFQKRGSVKWDSVVAEKLPNLDAKEFDRFRRKTTEQVKVTRM